MPIQTSKVTGRRTIRYANYDELLADAEGCATGNVRCLGNWSAGQIFEHLARTMTMSLDGVDFQAPWLMRFVARNFMKNSILNKPMPPGFNLPGKAAEALLPKAVPTEAGLASLRTAIHRLKTESKREPSPILGPLTREEWDKLHLNHSALHMSFLVPTGS